MRGLEIWARPDILSSVESRCFVHYYSNWGSFRRQRNVICGKDTLVSLKPLDHGPVTKFVVDQLLSFLDFLSDKP